MLRCRRFTRACYNKGLPGYVGTYPGLVTLQYEGGGRIEDVVAYKEPNASQLAWLIDELWLKSQRRRPTVKDGVKVKG